MSMAMLDMVGIPAHIEGIFITTPNGYYKVAEACAGVKFLVAMVAYGALVANMCFRAWSRRIAFMAACIIIPILANGVRAFATMYVGYLTTADTASSFDHVFYGWFFFAMVMALVMALVISMNGEGAVGLAAGHGHNRFGRAAVEGELLQVGDRIVLVEGEAAGQGNRLPFGPQGWQAGLLQGGVAEVVAVHLPQQLEAVAGERGPTPAAALGEDPSPFRAVSHVGTIAVVPVQRQTPTGGWAGAQVELALQR
jgi:exosortase/archaeosortase family protein